MASRRSWFRRLVNRLTGGSSRRPREPVSPPYDGTDFGPAADDVRDALPAGWTIVSLHYSDRDKAPLITSDPTDRQLAGADAIVVAHTSAGGVVSYRTIHGAPDRRTIGQLITDVIDAPGGSPI